MTKTTYGNITLSFSVDAGKEEILRRLSEEDFLEGELILKDIFGNIQHLKVDTYEITDTEEYDEESGSFV